MSSNYLSDMPDIATMVDNVQAAIDEAPAPGLPVVPVEVVQFFLTFVNSISDKLGLPPPFPVPINAPRTPPDPGNNLPETPQVPRARAPFKLPL